jgi:hypothetical protein
MIDRGEIWRRRLWVWLPALIFFLANAAAFSVYRLGYAGTVQGLDANLEARGEELKRLEAERKELEVLIQRVKTNREQVRQLYNERLATRSQRLTAITAEFRDLARKAGLEPKEISTKEEEIPEYGLVRRSFIFPVEGTYPELRKLINLLELSPSFFILENANLRSGGEDSPELRIDLTISTLFAREPTAGQELPGTAGTRPAVAEEEGE